MSEVFVDMANRVLGVKLRGPTNYEQLDVNLSPTLTLLEAARQHCPELRRFVYGSSDVLFPHSGWMPEPIQTPSILPGKQLS